jgi:hypothetical protein
MTTENQKLIFWTKNANQFLEQKCPTEDQEEIFID